MNIPEVFRQKMVEDLVMAAGRIEAAIDDIKTGKTTITSVRLRSAEAYVSSVRKMLEESE